MAGEPVLIVAELGGSLDDGTPAPIAPIERDATDRYELALKFDFSFSSHRELMLSRTADNETCCASADVPPMAVASSRFLSEFSDFAAKEDGSNNKSRQRASGPTFRMPPLRWRGALGNAFGWAGAAGSSTMMMSETMDLTGSTFVWQPWFLQVGLRGSMARSSSTSSGSASGATKGLGLSGGATLNFFSYSRFPASVFFNAYQSTTRTAGANVSGGYNFGARGSYKAEGPGADYRLSYARSVTTQDGSEATWSDRINGGYTNEFKSFLAGSHSVTATGGWTHSAVADGTYDNTFYNLTGGASSDYYDDYGISLQSTANFYVNQSIVARRSSNTVSVLLLNTGGSWTPEEDIPLGVNGTANFSSQNTRSADFSFSSQNASATLNASYRYSQQVGFAGYAAVNWAQPSGRPAIVAVMGGGTATYGFSGEARRLGDFNYTWGGSAGAGVSASSLSAAGSVGDSDAQRVGLSVSSSLSHQVSRPFDLGPMQQLNLNMSQSISGGASSLGAYGSFSSSGGLSYTVRPREAVTLSASFSASDSRAFGKFGSNFQSISSSVNGSAQINRFSNLSANISGGFNRTGESITAGTDKVTNAKWTAYGSANANYQHSRAFGYSGLRYNAGYSLAPPGWGSATTPTVQPWGHSFNQGVSYRIGRISMSLTNNISVLGTQRSAAIMLNVVREIGNY